MNNGVDSIKTLYRLFIASSMLYNVNVPGRRSAHNYPKMQLSYLLILQYWKSIDHCTYKMMLNNMGIFNEELGEIGFSILARASLGDHIKDDFDHMSKLYKLMPVYRDLKREVLRDNNIATSLSWRHKIDIGGDEVMTCGLFFKKIIRQIVAGTYRSYSSVRSTYVNASRASNYSAWI